VQCQPWLYRSVQLNVQLNVSMNVCTRSAASVGGSGCALSGGARAGLPRRRWAGRGTRLATEREAQREHCHGVIINLTAYLVSGPSSDSPTSATASASTSAAEWWSVSQLMMESWVLRWSLFPAAPAAQRVVDGVAAEMGLMPRRRSAA
jgi:hypothetical protein